MNPLEQYTEQVRAEMKRISAKRLNRAGRKPSTDKEMNDLLDKLLPYYKTIIFMGFSEDNISPKETAKMIVENGIDKF
jgi:hypothetical protein